MEFEIPDWLNKEFIKDTLQDGKPKSGGNNINIESLEIEKPVAKGDNYVSDVFRVLVQYRQHEDKKNDVQSTALIIKAPKVGGIADFLLNSGIIQKEVMMYSEYLPEMNKLFGDDKRLTPNQFFSSRENVIILEDLKFKGYVMADRRAQFDFEHAALAIKALAKFHAASVRLHEDKPELLEKVGKEMFFSEHLPEINKQYGKINFTVIANEARNNPELERYADQLLAFADNAWDILVEMMKPKDYSLNVLNHGDFWVNNMLFKYNDKKQPIDMKLIDLQVSRYTRPSIDLNYFIYGSLQEDVRINRIDELLKIYVDELNNYLEKFGLSQRLTESEIKTMVDDCEFFGLFVSISLFPVIIGDPKDGVMEMTEITEDQILNFQSSDSNHPLAGYYRNKRFQNVLSKRLAEFGKKGWF